MHGRLPKPVHLQLMEGHINKKSKAELERLKKNDEKVQFKSDNIKPPAWLSTEGKKTFRQLVKEFEFNGLLMNVDTYALGMFCDAYADYIRYTKTIAEEGDMMEHINKMGKTNNIPHPLITKKTQAFSQMDKMMAKLGLSPIDRARLVRQIDVEDDVKDDPFSDRL